MEIFYLVKQFKKKAKNNENSQTTRENYFIRQLRKAL